jgi:hypothetical protein
VLAVLTVMLTRGLALGLGPMVVRAELLCAS